MHKAGLDTLCPELLEHALKKLDLAARGLFMS
jgi:hypothetical protein